MHAELHDNCNTGLHLSIVRLASAILLGLAALRPLPNRAQSTLSTLGICPCFGLLHWGYQLCVQQTNARSAHPAYSCIMRKRLSTVHMHDSSREHLPTVQDKSCAHCM